MRTSALRNQSGRVEVARVAGDADVQTTYSIQARTSHADIESDWPVLLNPRQENPFADMDPATPQITLENQSGRIRITRE